MEQDAVPLVHVFLLYLVKYSERRMLRDQVAVDSFTVFVGAFEPRLRHALIAGYGLQVAQDAAAEALAYGWEHWDRISQMSNPSGYLYRVGQTRARRLIHRNTQRPLLPAVPPHEPPWIEPSLPAALSRLSRRQRTVVWLVHGLSWQYAEVAELLGISAGSARTHDKRGLAKLRSALGGVE